METRKVQVTGGSSYIVTLPKNWVDSVKLKKNDPVGLMVQPDGSLLITTKISGDEGHREKEFLVDEIKDPNYLFRLLISAYISGYSMITVKSEGRIQPFARDSVMKFTQTAIGPEIIEETDSSITIKDLLKPKEMPFDKTIKRMYMLAKGMHEDAITALRNKDKILAEEVVARDMSVDRLQWLIARQENLVLSDITLSKEMDIAQNEVIFYARTSRLIERIADHAVRIARNAITLMEKKTDKRLIETIASASQMAQGMFANSMAAWARKDMSAANDNIESVKKLVAICEEINDTALHIHGASAISVSYIAESIRRTGEYTGDVSETVINHLI